MLDRLWRHCQIGQKLGESDSLKDKRKALRLSAMIIIFMKSNMPRPDHTLTSGESSGSFASSSHQIIAAISLPQLDMEPVETNTLSCAVRLFVAPLCPKFVSSCLSFRLIFPIFLFDDRKNDHCDR